MRRTPHPINLLRREEVYSLELRLGHGYQTRPARTLENWLPEARDKLIKNRIYRRAEHLKSLSKSLKIYYMYSTTQIHCFVNDMLTMS